MEKFFPASARHAKAREFLELKQGNMTILEYIAKFTELARYGDDYVATDMAEVRKFEDGLKLSIRGKIVGFFLQDMNSMVRTVVAIEREIDDARSIHDAGTSDKRKEDQSSSVMKIKAQRIRDARAFTTYIETSILIMENSDLGGCETLETPNIFLFPSVLSLLLF